MSPSHHAPPVTENDDHHDNYRHETDKKITKLKQKLKLKNRKIRSLRAKNVRKEKNIKGLVT